MKAEDDYRAEMDAAWDREVFGEKVRATQEVLVSLAAFALDAATDWSGYQTWERLAPLYGMEAEG